MLSKIQNIFHLVITGILLVLVMVFSVQKCNRTNVIEGLEKKFSECINAPPDTVVKVITREVHDTTYIYPKPKYIYVKGDTIWDMDTIYDDPDHTYSWYNEEYTKDSIEINWEAQVYGYIQWIRFPEIRYPYKEITVTKTVTEFIPMHIPKNHIGLYFGARMYDFIHMPPLDAGLIVSIKDKYGFQIGGGYNFIDNRGFVEGKGIFYIR